MQVKTTMRYHLIVIRMVIIKKFTNKKCWRGCGVKGNLLNCCWNENWYSHYGEHYGDSIKTKNKSTIWPRNPTTGHKPWENHDSKRYMYPNVNCSIVYNRQDMDATKLTTNRWMDKEPAVYIYNEILLSHKKEQNTTICSKVDGLRVMLREISQTEKDKYCMTLLTCGI